VSEKNLPIKLVLQKASDVQSNPGRGSIKYFCEVTPQLQKAISEKFEGMALFVKTYETELVDQTFIKRLSAVDPDEIIRRGKVDFSTNKAALRFARVILSKYNSQQRGGRKLPYRFKG